MRTLVCALVAALVLATPARAQDAVPAVGGGSFNAAPQLEPGVTYRDSLLLGEYLYYALPVEIGQRLHVQVRIPDVDEETWERGQDAFIASTSTRRSASWSGRRSPRTWPGSATRARAPT